MIDIKVTSDVSAANEPILKVLSSDKMVEKFIKYDDTNAEETELIARMAKAARTTCEKFLGMSLAEKTLEVFVGRDYAKRRDWEFELPYGPVKLHATTGDITSVYAVGLDRTETIQTLNTGYNIIGNQFAKIHLSTISGTFPNMAADCNYKLTYTAGYDIETYTEAIPEAIRLAMMKLVYGWYHNRDNWLPILTSEAEDILMSFRRRAWF